MKLNESDIIDTVVQLWYNEKGITSETIINSFKTTGISVNLDGSEQNLIKKMKIYVMRLYFPMM